MAELGVGYSSEDKEVETFTRPGIAVITAPPELSSLGKVGQYAYLEVAKGGISPGLMMDRSDDEDSDHGGSNSDMYGGLGGSASSTTGSGGSKGRVSPSPYTANTERARLFNTYVRNLIEERLDTLIPISHQPRDLVQQVIADTNAKFPEFSLSTRKRIRTYLKSYRRSKRVRDMQAAAAIAHQYSSSSPSPTVLSNVTTTATSGSTANSVTAGNVTGSTVTGSTAASTGSNGVMMSGSDKNSSKEDSPLINIASISLPVELTSKQTSPAPALVTINSVGGAVEREAPVAKRPKLAPAPIVTPAPPPSSSAKLVPSTSSAKLVPPSTSSPAGGGGSFSNNEVSTLKQLIQGYRESAGFLNRAADQLEEMLNKDQPINN